MENSIHGPLNGNYHSGLGLGVGLFSPTVQFATTQVVGDAKAPSTTPGRTVTVKGNDPVQTLHGTVAT